MLIQVCIMFLLCLFAYLLVGCNAFIFDILCTLMTSRGDTKWPLSGPVTYDNKIKTVISITIKVRGVIIGLIVSELRRLEFEVLTSSSAGYCKCTELIHRKCVMLQLRVVRKRFYSRKPVCSSLYTN